MNFPLPAGWTRGAYASRDPFLEPARQFGDLPTPGTPLPEVEHERTAVGEAVDAMNARTIRWTIG